MKRTIFMVIIILIFTKSFSQEKDYSNIFENCEAKTSINLCIMEKIREEIQLNYKNWRESSSINYDNESINIKFSVLKSGNFKLDTIIGKIKNFEPEILNFFEKLPKTKPIIENGKEKDTKMTIKFFLHTLQKNEDEKEEEIKFDLINEVPVFPGCEEIEINQRMICFENKLRDHIVANLKYPKKALRKNIYGLVLVTYIIDKEGKITDISAEGGDILLQNEAIRIISLLPKLKPGMQKGKPVRFKHVIPITFKLQ